MGFYWIAREPQGKHKKCGKPVVSIGKWSTNGALSTSMLVYRRVQRWFFRFKNPTAPWSSLRSLNICWSWQTRNGLLFGVAKRPKFTWKGYHLAILNLVYPTMLFGEKLGEKNWHTKQCLTMSTFRYLVIQREWPLQYSTSQWPFQVLDLNWRYLSQIRPM